MNDAVDEFSSRHPGNPTTDHLPIGDRESERSLEEQVPQIRADRGNSSGDDYFGKFHFRHSL